MPIPYSDSEHIFAGVDEAGRGALAGPVVAAAVVLQPGLRTRYPDSKQVAAKRRLQLVTQLYSEDALAIGVGVVAPADIDRMNILQATMEAMRRAVAEVAQACTGSIAGVFVDGNRCPGSGLPEKAVVGGDRYCSCIGAASMVAKVSRDTWMQNLHQQYGHWDFDVHKGYGTAAHLDALRRFGASPVHRTSFGPVAEQIRQGQLFA